MCLACLPITEQHVSHKIAIKVLSYILLSEKSCLLLSSKNIFLCLRISTINGQI